MFEESPAWLAGQQVGYFRYAVPASVQVMAGLPVVPASVASAYAFDPTDAQPVPEENDCTPPAGWRPDPRLDAVNFEQQGNIFTALPTATYNPGVAASSNYLPVVAEVPLSSGGQVCQRFKSTKRCSRCWGSCPRPAGSCWPG